jgi:hypothetical protein
MAKSISELRGELATKERLLQKLEAKRGKLAVQLSKTDKQITALLGKTSRAIISAGAKRMRKGRKAAVSLGDILERALKGKGSIRVKDVANMALEAGYKTKSKHFDNIVSQTLKADKRFRRVRRGIYKLAK